MEEQIILQVSGTVNIEISPHSPRTVADADGNVRDGALPRTLTITTKNGIYRFPWGEVGLGAHSDPELDHVFDRYVKEPVGRHPMNTPLNGIFTFEIRRANDEGQIKSILLKIFDGERILWERK